jgi:chromosome segregation ATPase
MYKQVSCVAMTIFLMNGLSFAQTGPSESETLQALLSEVRSMHRDFDLTLQRMQAGQILLSRLQAQQKQLNRANDRMDESRVKLSQVQADEKHAADDLAKFEDELDSATDPAKKPELTEIRDHFKASVAALHITEGERVTAETDAEQQLRREQESFDDLNTQLNEIMRQIQPVPQRAP